MHIFGLYFVNLGGVREGHKRRKPESFLIQVFLVGEERTGIDHECNFLKNIAKIMQAFKDLSLTGSIKSYANVDQPEVFAQDMRHIILFKGI